MNSQQNVAAMQALIDREKFYNSIIELLNPETRQNALVELSRMRDALPDITPMLRNSFDTVTSLLQEIIYIYPAIKSATLTTHESNRVCNALALLQCFANNPETQPFFIRARIPLFLYPFLDTDNKTRPFEYLRMNSLGVIGTLVRRNEQEIIPFLLITGMIPLCLKTMENGSELSKTVATIIMYKILVNSNGLSYICETYDRFSHVTRFFEKMLLCLAKDPSVRLLKYVIKCYLRLSDDQRALLALRECLPDQLKDNTFTHCLQGDILARHWLHQLLKKLGPGFS
ncbi:CCR4-NOT transcription complex subunit 9-like isoform X2 [Phymastichus coffea]|uniref:CCR4-NOT transcription complex subunit 9-like isoform X2 n=1 Tax=Phymastichus coffea TaxID=108790 RepID=UPI00273AF035|nr:CCR4-NOT transcription complex subunit 9-like isoform X2 [Phymastichus coffea]